MPIFEIHIHNHVELDWLKKELLLINKTLNKMPTKIEFQQALTDITSGLDNIAADITRLTDQLQTGNLSDTEEQEIFNQLRATADRVKQLADQTPETETPSPDTE